MQVYLIIVSYVVIYVYNVLEIEIIVQEMFAPTDTIFIIIHVFQHVLLEHTPIHLHGNVSYVTLLVQLVLVTYNPLVIAADSIQ